jgi:broad specificity phosphatase PhoE
MTMRIFLARHGETEWNVEHRLQGRADTRLTRRGEDQARALAELVRGLPLEAIYTSTLRRTIDTARPSAAEHNLKPEARPELVEISYGVLEGCTGADPDVEIRRLWKARKADPLAFVAPGGESYAQLRDRVAPFVAELGRRHSGGTALVVGHRATNRVLVALLLGLGLDEALGFKHKHDVVLEIRPGMEPACLQHRHAALADGATVERGMES